MIYIALLRGINVGGHKKIKMEALRNSLESLHFKNLKTYIQSGNIIFQYKNVNVKKIAANISKIIKEDFDFDVLVIVKTKAELEAVFLNNPYEKDNEIESLYVTFLSENPKVELKDKLGDFGDDKYCIKNDIIYLCYATKASDTKLSNNIIETRLKVVATTRNWKTIQNVLNLVHT